MLLIPGAPRKSECEVGVVFDVDFLAGQTAGFARVAIFTEGPGAEHRSQSLGLPFLLVSHPSMRANWQRLFEIESDPDTLFVPPSPATLAILIPLIR